MKDEQSRFTAVLIHAPLLVSLIGTADTTSSRGVASNFFNRLPRKELISERGPRMQYVFVVIVTNLNFRRR